MGNFIHGQNFEGKIIYYVEYQSLKTYKYDSTGNIGLGMTETFYIKNGDYLITGDGNKKEWVLYKNTTNKIYEKYRNNDTLYVIDAGKDLPAIEMKQHFRNSSKTLATNSKTGKIAKRKDNEYVFIIGESQVYYYYNKKYQLNGKLFANHKYEYLSDFVNLTNCIPLARNYTFEDFNCSKTAYEFIPETLNEKLFEIPKNLIIKE